jgi:hypothetical protein
MRAIRWIDDVAVLHLAVYAIAAAIGFALAYWRWGGLRFSNGNSGVDLPNCVYMSVVTFTTLGYGDIVPVGYAKVLACIEVVTGLGFFGVGIAKLSSATQSYLLGQLYAREAQGRFEGYIADLRSLRDDYETVLHTLKAGQRVEPSLGAHHRKAQSLLRRIRDFASFEINNGDLLRRMPTGPVGRVLRACTQLVPLVTEVANIPTSLHSKRQRRLAKTVIRQIQEISDLIFKNCNDQIVLAKKPKLTSECETSIRNLEAAL